MPTRADVTSMACFLALVVPHFVWRRWYYGWWLPNTFYIKASGTGGHWQQGGYYLLRVVETFHFGSCRSSLVAGVARASRARLAPGCPAT